MSEPASEPVSTARVEVRTATDDDWAGIWPIWRRVVAAGDTYTWDADTPEAEARAAWMLPPPAEVLVAVDDDGTVAGTAEIRPNQAGRGSHVANASFMVDPDRTGAGIGQALTDTALDRARAAGYRAMQFNAVVATNTRAVALWRSRGFTVVGTVPGAFHHATEGDVDLLVMHRFL